VYVHHFLLDLSRVVLLFDKWWYTTTISERMAQMDQKTLSVPEAGKLYFNIGRNASYEAAARGEIITIRVGKLLRVPIAAMERKLAEAGRANPA
jgi:hypothetical protein